MLKSLVERYLPLLVLAVLGVFWIQYSREPAQWESSFVTEAPIVGHLAPDFVLQSSLGQTVVLADLINRDGAGGIPVVLNFWASWCGPCRIETPHFQAMSLQYQDQIAILGVNQGESLSTISDFAISFGLTYPLLFDAQNEVNDAYNVFNLPTTIFIDSNGVVSEVYVGAIGQAVLMERINRLVAE